MIPRNYLELDEVLKRRVERKREHRLMMNRKVYSYAQFIEKEKDQLRKNFCSLNEEQKEYYAKEMKYSYSVPDNIPVSNLYCLASMKQFPSSLPWPEYLEGVKNDAEIMFNLISLNRYLVRYVGDDLKKDPKFIISVLGIEKNDILTYFDSQIAKDIADYIGYKLPDASGRSLLRARRIL